MDFLVCILYSPRSFDPFVHIFFISFYFMGLVSRLYSYLQGIQYILPFHLHLGAPYISISILSLSLSLSMACGLISFEHVSFRG